MNGTLDPVVALDGVPGIAAGFIGRIPNLPVSLERADAMALLSPIHRRILGDSGFGNLPMVTAEKVHGNLLAEVTGKTKSPVPLADALMTKSRGLTIGVYVADCAPVWIVARNGSAGALVHSGKKGTELGIVPKAINRILEASTLAPEDLRLVIGPCIRPPCYEIDFAAIIGEQARNCGVTDVHDEKICTACHPDLYYSYRREKGLTGRMLATLTLLP